MTREKAIKELKKKLVDNELSSKVQSQRVQQLEEEASDQYVIGYSRAHLESLHTFRDGQLVLANAKAKIAKLTDFMSDAEEKGKPNHTDGEAARTLGRLKKDAMESITEVELKGGRVEGWSS